MSTDRGGSSARLTRARRDDISGSVAGLVELAKRGLAEMYRPERRFVQTIRRDVSAPHGLRAEGENLRYAAIVALGLSHIEQDRQREMLSGITAAELSETVAGRAVSAPDLGAAALASWAAAEVRREAPSDLFARLVGEVKRSLPLPTVDLAWTLTALTTAPALGDFANAAEQAADRLRAAQGDAGTFPHALPRETLGRYRAHVGCFADQVYPIQALARYFVATGDRRALDAANRCANRIVELQGPAGQWWWHYDVRTGEVVEGYPVYSVHQHAMAPMALFELHESGGNDHDAAITAGLAWLRTHPEGAGELIDEGAGVVWRKIGRREPRKAVRSIRAVSTSLRPALRLGPLDLIFPPDRIDYECRPYELGWLLYTWCDKPTTPAGGRGG